MNALRAMLLENLGLKLVALLLALLVYLHVYTDRPATMVVSFPIQIQDLGDSLAISGTMPPPVLAELRGTGKQLIRLRLTEPRLQLSLARVQAGHFQRTLTVEDLPLMASDRLEVVRLLGPTMLELDLDRRITRRVPVAARVMGAPHPPAEWDGTVLVDPPTALVRGPRKDLIHLDSLRLRAVHIDSRRDTLHVLAAPESLPAGAESDPAMMKVTVPILKKGRASP